MFKTPASAAPLGNKAEIDARYRYWRRHILVTIWLGYALFYFTRKSFNAAAPEILASGVMARTDIGLLATLFYITYGLSKFFSGIVSDRSNARYFMGVGLIATDAWRVHFNTEEVLLRSRFRHSDQRGAHAKTDLQRHWRIAAKQLGKVERLLAELNAHHRPVVIQRVLLPFCQAALTADKAANTAQRATVFIKFR